MTFIYPFIIIIIVDNISTIDYFTQTGEAFQTLFTRVVNLTAIDIVILAAGFIGTIVSGFVIKYLRKNGYQMF
ncbi:Putative membrane protein [Oceanobacillus limi]|uniref:Putative membrane protein n=2 Tax=Oceanobacillus limi TaxID=930131 RepID=A0A1I0DPI1_9BACI|nr:Putative membrane protein [Oceanobacillus limi]